MKKLSIKLQTAYVIVLLIQEYLAFNKTNSSLNDLLINHNYISSKEVKNNYLKLCKENNDFMGETIINMFTGFAVPQQKQLIEKPDEIFEEVLKQIRKK